MKDKLLKLLEKRSAISKQKADLLDLAINEGRSLTEDERKKHESLINEIRALDDLVKLVEEQVKEEEALNAAQSRTNIGPSASTPPSAEERSATKPSDSPRIEVISEKRFKSLGHFYQSVIRSGKNFNDADDVRRLREYDHECRASGLSVGIGSDGGFLVPSEQTALMQEQVFTTGEIMSRVNRIRSSTGGTLKMPGVDETSRANGSRWGGITSYWVKEGGVITTSKPKFRIITLEANKIAIAVYLTDELMSDVAALESFVSQAAPEELNIKAEEAVFEGNGAGEPLGFMNSGALVTVSKENNQAAGTIKAENIFKMWSRLTPVAQRNAVWFKNQDCTPQLCQMSLAVGTGGIPVYLPANGLVSAPFETLMGRPLIPSEHCKSVGTVGDLVLADLGGYIMRTIGDIKTASSMHVRFLYDESVLKFTWRLDGQPFRSTPLTPKNGSNTLSSFIALETRS